MVAAQFARSKMSSSSYNYHSKKKRENAKYDLLQYTKEHALPRPQYTCTEAAVDPSSGGHGDDDGGYNPRSGRYIASVQVGTLTFTVEGELFASTRKAEIAAAVLAWRRIVDGGEHPSAPRHHRRASTRDQYQHQLKQSEANGGWASVLVWPRIRAFTRKAQRNGTRVLSRSNVPTVVFVTTLVCYLQHLPPHFEFTDHGRVDDNAGSNMALTSVIVSDIAGNAWNSAARGCGGDGGGGGGNNWWSPLGVSVYRLLSATPSVNRHLASTLLHALCASLVARTTLLLAQRQSPTYDNAAGEAPAKGDARGGIAALVAGLLFAFHPAHTSTLRFAESQSELLATAMALFVIYSAIEAVSYTHLTLPTIYSV